jgi:hypothetical protein
MDVRYATILLGFTSTENESRSRPSSVSGSYHGSPYRHVGTTPHPFSFSYGNIMRMINGPLSWRISPHYYFSSFYLEHECILMIILMKIIKGFVTLSIQNDCLTFRIFGPKKNVRFFQPGRKLRFKVKYLRSKLSISRSLLTPQLSWAFHSSCCFLFKSHT